MPVSTKEALLSVVNDENGESFVKFMNKFSTATTKNVTHMCELDETVESMSDRELEKVWVKLRGLVTFTVMSLVDRQDDEELLEQDMKGVSEVFQCVVNMATATLSVITTSGVPPALLETAVVLHGMMLSLPDSAHTLTQSMVRMYSSWWTRGLEGRGEVIPNTLIYLLQVALAPKATGADIKRVWAISDCLHAYPVTRLISEPLRSLLLDCLGHKMFIKTSEGNKFLSLILRLNVDFVEVVHELLISQLPSSSQTTLATYGTVYFRAWCESSGDLLQKLETTCIQDLIYRAVHANRQSPRSVFRALHAVLHNFHSQKLHKGVDEMLHRLYEPILWRSLKVANGHVRANAASLLMDIFPVRNAELNVGENDVLLQKQFDMLQTLLMDPFHEVRALSALGVSRVLTTYWGIIPADVIHSLLSTLTNDLVYDTSSPDVRAAVIKGLTEMLDQFLCHPVLKKILPKLCSFIHDTAEKVRLAMVQLLLVVKDIRSIKFGSVVPMEHLLSRLDLDTPAVCRKIALLLRPSFLPLTKPRPVLLERCLALVEANPAAVRPFYQYAHTHMDLACKVSYIIMLCRCVLLCVRKNSSRNNDTTTDTENSQQHDEDVSESEVTMDQTGTISCLLEVVAILWATIESDLAKPVNAEHKTNLQRKFAIALPEFMQAFQDPVVYSTLVTIAGFMPPKLVPHLSRSCLSTLRDMSDAAPPSHRDVALEAMVKWGKTGDLLEMIAEWIEAGVTRGVEKPPDVSIKAAHNPPKKTVGFVTTHVPRPVLGVQYLTCLLRQTLSRSNMFQFFSPHLRRVRTALARITECVERRVGGHGNLEGMCTDEFLARAFELHHKLEILYHKTGDGDDDVCCILEQEFTWADSTLLPLLRTKPECPTLDQDRSLALTRQILTVMLETGRSVLMVGAADQQCTSLISDFCRSCLRTGVSTSFLPDVARVLHQIIEYTTVNRHDSDEGIGADADLVLPLFDLVLSTLAVSVREDTCTEQWVASVRKALAEVLEATHRVTRETTVANIRASLISALLADLCHASQQGDLDPATEYTLDSLPVVSNVLLGIVTKKKYMSVWTLQELQQCVESGAMTSPHLLHAALHLTASLHPHCPRVCDGCMAAIGSQLVIMERVHLADHSVDSPERLLLSELKGRVGDV